MMARVCLFENIENIEELPMICSHTWTICVSPVSISQLIIWGPSFAPCWWPYFWPIRAAMMALIRGKVPPLQRQKNVQWACYDYTWCMSTIRRLYRIYIYIYIYLNTYVHLSRSKRQTCEFQNISCKHVTYRWYVHSVSGVGSCQNNRYFFAPCPKLNYVILYRKIEDLRSSIPWQQKMFDWLGFISQLWQKLKVWSCVCT